MMWLVNLFLVLAVAAASIPNAVADPIFGWELEFSNKKLRSTNFGELNAQANYANDAAREKWLKVVQKLQKSGGNFKIREIEDWVSWHRGDGYTVWSWEVASYRVIYPDGFWWQMSYDSEIVEVQIKPSTVEDLRRNRDRIQHDMFDTALKAGLKPPVGEETHIHVGAHAAFGLDLHLIRNFLVDGINHPELTFLFAKSLANAPPLILMPKGKHDNFRGIVGQVDSGEIADLDTFVKKVRSRVYDETYDDEMENVNDKAQKYQQWNIERLRRKMKDGEKTVENRAVPHPADADDVVDLTALQKARVDYVVSKGGKNIQLVPYKPKLSLVEQVGRYRAYIEESGLDPKTYRRFLRKACERALLTRSR
jgi:hypothetical protein